MIFVGYKRCSTSGKAEQYLSDKNIPYDFRDIKSENPTKEELTDWYKTSGLPLKRFFNTSGMLYKEMNLKDKIPTMSEDEQLSLLSTNGLLVKRPILIADGFVLVGFKPKEWDERF